MKKIRHILLITVLMMSLASILSAQTKTVQVEIKTSAGTILIKLYNETPLHKANFIKLVNEKYYDGILFHRVIKDFMIQAGDPNSKTASPGQPLGSGGPNYTINAEFKQTLIHKKGALSAARTGDDMNPQKKSSGSQFYIVQGKKYTAQELDQIEKQVQYNVLMPHIREYLNKPENSALMSDLNIRQQLNDNDAVEKILNDVVLKIKAKNPAIKGFKYTPQQRNIYQTIGGTPFLDMNYTVFGEVVKGLEIVDKIAAVKTGQADRPVQDIKIISMRVIK
jgi:cyclophilin family peptidyl-prolyl cis-trans isomerase